MRRKRKIRLNRQHEPTTPPPPTKTDYTNTPYDVAAAWTRYNRQLIHDDTLGWWFAFSLTTAYTEYALHQTLLTRARAVGRLCGLHDTNNTPQQRKYRGVLGFLLPAVSYAGFPHYHGLLRVPRAYCCDDKVMTIQEHGRTIPIIVPSSVREYFRWFPLGAHLNLHLLHAPDDTDLTGALRRALPLHTDLLTASSRALNYWSSRADGELRRFDEAEWFPWETRAALPNADTTKRGVW